MIYREEYNKWREQFKKNIKSLNTREALYIVNTELFYSNNKSGNFNSKILINNSQLDEDKDFVIINKTLWSKIKKDYPNEKEIKFEGIYQVKKYNLIINNFIYYFYYVNEKNHLIEGYYRFELPNQASEIFSKFMASDFNDFINNYGININSNSLQIINKNDVTFFFRIKSGIKKKNDINNNNNQFNNFGNIKINANINNNINRSNINNIPNKNDRLLTKTSQEINSFINKNMQINQYNYNQINNSNNLNQELKNEKIKNQKLEAEIEELRNEYKQNQLQLENKIKSLTTEIQKLQKENQSLKHNRINIQNNQMNNNEINKLNQIIMQKDNQIKELELKLQKNVKNKIYRDDIIVVNFMSTDQAINTGIACTADDTFAEVEEKLYQIYDEFRNTNNILLHKGNMILRFKKIKDNNIKNGDKIIVKTPE